METRGKLCVESIGQAKSEKFSEIIIQIVRLLCDFYCKYPANNCFTPLFLRSQGTYNRKILEKMKRVLIIEKGYISLSEGMISNCVTKFQKVLNPKI